MTGLQRWVPRLIVATALLHLALGVSFAPSGEFADEGFLGVVGGDPEREGWLWYMVAGMALLGLGELARWTAQETGRLPARLGGWLLAAAVPLILAIPASGGWLVVAVGALALRAARSGSPRPAERGAAASIAVHR